MRPLFISTKNIFPGFNLPWLSMSSGAISTTPISEAIINLPLLVTVYLEGLKPFLSNSAPI